MSSDPQAQAIERLRLAFDLYGAGEAMMRQTLRRSFPGASAAEIEQRLSAWLELRPGALVGDAVGVLRRWPPDAR